MQLSEDGRVDPGGRTLQRMQDIQKPLKLSAITPDRVSKGGYKLSIHPVVPRAPYVVTLGFSESATDCVDITGRDGKDIFDKPLLEELLPIIETKKFWGTSQHIRAYVRIGSRLLSRSDAVSLPCPVQPHNGKLLPLDVESNGPSLLYLGDSQAKNFYGRMLEYVPSLEAYVFKYGGVIETKNDFRGFDCITYVGTVCGASTSNMFEASDTAAHLGAVEVEFEHKVNDKPTKVKLEKADPKLVKEFFETTRPDSYIMWGHGHVVLVVNMTVHEFAESKKGYAATEVTQWLKPYKTEKLTLRKVKM